MFLPKPIEVFKAVVGLHADYLIQVVNLICTKKFILRKSEEKSYHEIIMYLKQQNLHMRTRAPAIILIGQHHISTNLLPIQKRNLYTKHQKGLMWCCYKLLILFDVLLFPLHFTLITFN